MKVKLAAILFLSVSCLAGRLYAQRQFYLPQVANGQFTGGSIRTTFVIFNTSGSSVTATIKLTRDDGGPLEVTIPELGIDDEFVLTLEAGATRILQTDGSGQLAAGAAIVNATEAIGVSAIFSIFDASGNFLTEAGVGSSLPLTEFVIPVDTMGTFNTGVAFLNFLSSAVSLSIRLLDSLGQERGNTTRTLGGSGHEARFVTELFPAATNFRGTMVVRSTGPVAALTLRQNSSPLSFTTLPVVSRASTQREFNLPQVANGQFTGGSIRTSFLIFNISSSRATVNLSLTQDDGSPLRVTIPGLGTGNAFSINLEPGAATFLQTDGSGALTAGAATVSSNVAIGVSAIFSIFDSQGRFLTEAGVGDSPAQRDFTIPVDITARFDTGVAFFNPGMGSVTLTVRLLDGNGGLVNTITISLGGRNHRARFVSELFPGTRNFRGSLSISATGDVAALTLRQNADPLSFTTLPVARGAFSGGPPRPTATALLQVTRTGINATSDVTVNVTLPSGFRLSGTIRGPRLVEATITARASDGTVFVGGFNPTTSRYLVIVSAGTFNLTVCYTPQLALPLGLPDITFEDPTPVQVSADTTRDIVLPTLTTYMVTGTVSNLDRLPPTTQAILDFSSSDGRIGGTALVGPGGSYQAQLPNGNYIASLIASTQTSPTGFQMTTIFNLGSVNVSGADVMANFSVPATARLSGTVRTADMSPLPAGSVVLANDASAPQTTAIACALPPANSTSSIGATGGYQMVLASGRNYGVFATLPVIPFSIEAGTFGSFNFPFPPREVRVAADMTHNIDLPPLPGRVTISGQVTDGGGRGVANVTVTAITQEVTGAPNAAFSAGARTDSSGNYRLTALSGTNYRLTFAPPPPEP